MDTQNKPDGGKTKNITLGLVIAWIFSIFVGFFSIVILFSSPAEGTVLLLATFIVFPPMNKILVEKYNISLSRGLKIVAVLILFVVVGLMASDKSPNSQQTSQGSVTEKVPSAKAAIKVSAVKLSEEYKANEISADAKYKGNVVEVSGVVGNIAKDFLDTPYIVLKTSEYAIMDSVQCMFSKTDEPQLATIVKGRQIILRGEVSGKMGNILVRKCQIVN